MMTDREEILQRADEARQLLGAPLLKEAFADLEQAYVEALLDCKKEDDLGRFRLSEGMKVLRLVRRHLETYVESGEIAVREAESARCG